MEKKAVVTKRFQKNIFNTYNWLLETFSAAVAFNFLDKLQQRIELIIQNPEIGKPSQKAKNIRSLILHPHNKIYYRITVNTIELLCLFDMRKKKEPY
jgi:plasmid stabilization system protein ParE